MPRKRRRNFTAEEKVSILREALVDRAAVSEVCESHGIQPSQFYTWQKELFENGAAAFSNKRGPKVDRSSEKIDALQVKIQSKNEVLAELMEEHVALKKSLGVI